MIWLYLCLVLYFEHGDCKLWNKGVVHYSINQKDYDVHSQDIITSTFEQLEREVCVKFFSTPTNRTGARADDKILYISNPDKSKTCPPVVYNYSESVVPMKIGYKCINSKDIARITVEMIRASIDQSGHAINSYDLLKKFREKDQDTATTLLTPDDRNYINSYYFTECGSLAARPFAPSRRADDLEGVESPPELKYYVDKVWPLGIIMYGVEPSLRGTSAHTLLKFAMTAIELGTCVTFQYQETDDVLEPKNSLWFTDIGAEIPEYGFKEGTQNISLAAMTEGAAGHSAHAINNLLRALGIPMMSNRYDRDNYVIINWKNVQKGKEHLLEKEPAEAWWNAIPYDFKSASHAPANFACNNCGQGQATVQPVQDHLWQRTLSMGHVTSLSDSDVKLISRIYGKECEKRIK